MFDYFVLPAFLTVLFFMSIIYLFTRFKVIHGQRAAVVERLGVPRPTALRPGLHFIPPFSKIRMLLNLEQFQTEKQSSVKTSDDAFINIKWVVRYSIQSSDAAILAYVYKVAKPVDQMVWRVENELRQLIASMSLNELYLQKDTLAQRIVADQLTNALETGLQIDGVVIEPPMPPEEVQKAMNNKIAALARQDAAAAEAEAERRKRVGIARAEAESKQLQGEGIAKQRMAVAQGFKDSYALLAEGMPEATAGDVLALMTQTIQNDMVVTASSSGKATIIFVPLGMGSVAQVANMLPTATQAAA